MGSGVRSAVRFARYVWSLSLKGVAEHTVHPMFSPDRAALVLVDVQQAFHDPSWGTRNNLDCEANIGRLLALPDPVNGGRIDADTLARVTAANLHAEFAQVMSTDQLIAGP
jgi:hypothetical protein